MFFSNIRKFTKSPPKVTDPKNQQDDRGKQLGNLLKDLLLTLKKAGKSEIQKKQSYTDFLQVHEAKSANFKVNGKAVVAGLEWENRAGYSQNKMRVFSRYLEKIFIKQRHSFNNQVGFQADIYFKSKQIRQQRAVSLAVLIGELREIKKEELNCVSKCISLTPTSIQGSRRVLDYDLYLIPIEGTNLIASCGFDFNGNVVSMFDASFNASSKEQFLDTMKQKLKLFCEQTQCSIDVKKREISFQELEKLATPSVFKSVYYSNSANREIAYIKFFMAISVVLIGCGFFWQHLKSEEQKALEKKTREEQAIIEEQLRIERIEQQKQLVKDAENSLNTIRSFPNPNLVYASTIIANLSALPKSISENRGEDSWRLLTWECTVVKYKNQKDILQSRADCSTVYQGESLADVDVFYYFIYNSLAKNEDVNFLFQGLNPSYEKDRNLVNLHYSIPIEISRNTIKYSKEPEVVRKIQSLRSKMRSLGFEFEYADQGPLILPNENYKTALTTKNSVGNDVFPYGSMEWTLGASINSLRSSGAFLLPVTYSITKVSGTTENISLTGRTYYE